MIAEWDKRSRHRQSFLLASIFQRERSDGSDDANVTLAQFEGDALKNEPLIAGYTHFIRLFRFPFFKEGDTREKRDGMRVFLRQHGYRIGRATIDASDWAISSRMEKRIQQDGKAALSPIAISSCSTSGSAPSFTTPFATRRRAPGAPYRVASPQSAQRPVPQRSHQYVHRKRLEAR